MMSQYWLRSQKEIRVLTADLGGVLGAIEVGDPEVELVDIARSTVGIEPILEI
jgi:hypothetical protein